MRRFISGIYNRFSSARTTVAQEGLSQTARIDEQEPPKTENLPEEHPTTATQDTTTKLDQPPDISANLSGIEEKYRLHALIDNYNQALTKGIEEQNLAFNDIIKYVAFMKRSSVRYGFHNLVSTKRDGQDPRSLLLSTKDRWTAQTACLMINIFSISGDTGPKRERLDNNGDVIEMPTPTRFVRELLEYLLKSSQPITNKDLTINYNRLEVHEEFVDLFFRMEAPWISKQTPENIKKICDIFEALSEKRQKAFSLRSLCRHVIKDAKTYLALKETLGVDIETLIPYRWDKPFDYLPDNVKAELKIHAFTPKKPNDPSHDPHKALKVMGLQTVSRKLQQMLYDKERQ